VCVSFQNLPLMRPTSTPSQSTRTISPRDTKPFPSLPTPTPTSASVISDEDAAIQLMRLTDPLATPLLSPSIIDENEEHMHHTEASGMGREKGVVPGERGAGDADFAVEEEHSRCTRCIGAKKGCDRRRPCGRCVGQGFENDCISDDEIGTARRKVAALRRSSMIGRSIVSRGKRSRGR